MYPVSPVMPGSKEIEIVLGEGQPQYIPLPAVWIDSPARPMVIRYRLTEEERRAVADGADIVMQQLTFHSPFHPVNLQVVGRDEMPVLIEEPNCEDL